MLRVKKENFIFPSMLLGQVTRDEVYSDLYFGNYFEVKKDEVVSKNIPMDPQKFDWNEFEKEQQRLTHYFSKKLILLSRIANIFFIIGFAVAIVGFLGLQSPYNSIVLGLYILLLIIKEVGVSISKLGMIVEKGSLRPLPYAIVRVYSANLGNEVIHKVATAKGQFYLLIPNGLYVVSIEKKNHDGSYTKVFTSEILTVKKGILKGVWEV